MNSFLFPVMFAWRWCCSGQRSGKEEQVELNLYPGLGRAVVLETHRGRQSQEPPWQWQFAGCLDVADVAGETERGGWPLECWRVQWSLVLYIWWSVAMTWMFHQFHHQCFISLHLPYTTTHPPHLEPISWSLSPQCDGIEVTFGGDWASLVAQTVKNLPAMWGTRIQSLGQGSSPGDPLEKKKAAHSSILACRIPWAKESDGLRSMGSQRVGYDWVILTHSLRR